MGQKYAPQYLYKILYHTSSNNSVNIIFGHIINIILLIG